MNYEAAVRYLFGLLGGIRKSSFGLERMEALVARLGHPERSFRVVHVAGTNGKGSVCAFIEAGLRAAGCRVGMSTSPHLVRINERVRIDGADVSDEAFAAAVVEVREANEALLAAGGRGAHPTFFESAMAVAFCAFRAAGVEWAVIETGLGGRLDASNVVRPDLCVITPIGLDHERFLGAGYAAIAGEKAGILKVGARAVFAPQPTDAQVVLEKRAEALGLDWSSTKRWRVSDESAVEGRWRYTAETDGGVAVRAELGLAGRHQCENSLTAAVALDAMDVGVEAIESGMRAVDWPGRLEVVEGTPDVLVDAAHNPAGARALAEFVGTQFPDREIRLIYGASRDKAIEESAGWLFPVAERVILTRSFVARGVRPATLADMLSHLHDDLEVAKGIEEALAAARSDAGGDTLIVVAGSLFLVGEALVRLRPERYGRVQTVEG